MDKSAGVLNHCAELARQLEALYRGAHRAGRHIEADLWKRAGNDLDTVQRHVSEALAANSLTPRP